MNEKLLITHNSFQFSVVGIFFKIRWFFKKNILEARTSTMNFNPIRIVENTQDPGRKNGRNPVWHSSVDVAIYPKKALGTFFGETTMCSILIIDDDKGILFLIREVLTKFGHCVEVAMDGYEGIQKFDDSSFDIVITDMCMPGMDGRGVLEHIRNSPKRSTPVIGISGTPWLLRNEDFDMVLLKPFALQKLIESVTSLINLPLKEAAGA